MANSKPSPTSAPGERPNQASAGDQQGPEAARQRLNDVLNMLPAYVALTRFKRARVGRELRMIELKNEINALCAQSGQPLRYPPDFQEEPSPASDSP
jgi:hypothetical protein